MSDQSGPEASTVDTAKLVGSVFLLLVGIVGFHYFSSQLLLYRIIGVVSLSAAAVAVILTTSLGKGVLLFMKEARVEVRKVVWPTRQETVQATLVVVALVFLVGLILWLLDMVLFWGISTLTG